MSPKAVERLEWRDYRGREHAWSAVRALGMQRSRCGYLVGNIRLSEPSGRRCALCACMLEQTFAAAPKAGAADSIERLKDVRRIYAHVRRAMLALRTTSLDAAVCEEALVKLGQVEKDLVRLFRLERAGTRNTADDAALSESDIDGAPREFREN